MLFQTLRWIVLFLISFQVQKESSTRPFVGRYAIVAVRLSIDKKEQQKK